MDYEIGLSGLIARNNPEKIAVHVGNAIFTYGELERDSNQIAGFLSSLMESRGVLGGQVLIATMANPGYELIATMLGVHKCGAIYVPLSANYPPERVKLILEDSGSLFLIVQKSLHSQNKMDYPHIFLEDLWQGSKEHPKIFGVQRNPIFALLYTSGTTGTPKGVKMTEIGLIRLTQDEFCCGIEGDKWLAFNNPAFDAALLDTWVPLMRGLEVVIYPFPEFSAELLVEIVEAKGISMIFTTTGLFNLLVDNWLRHFERIRCWFFGGEKASPRHVLKALGDLPSVQLIHAYGPTETTVFALRTQVAMHSKFIQETGSVPIGTPIAETKVYLLDDDLLMVGPGDMGEIFIGGIGVADGYWKRDSLTGERFIPDPFAGNGSKMYRTGDIARMEGQNFVYHGRRDNQIKLRGFRIELLEIENIMQTHPNILQAVVTCHESSSKEKFLCAHFVPRKGFNPPSSLDLSYFLEDKLPYYMIPSFFLAMEKLPLNSNHKVARDELKPPIRKLSRSPSGLYPTSDIQCKVATIWGNVLGIREDLIRISDGFLDLGGNSLLLNKLGFVLQREFGAKIPISILFQNCSQLDTLCQLLVQLDSPSSIQNETISTKKDQFPHSGPTSSGQQRLWIHSSRNPEDPSYNIILVYDLEGDIQVRALEESFIRLMEKHPILRTEIRLDSFSMPVQRIAPLPKAFSVPILRATLSDIQRVMDDEARLPFDLGIAPLFRVKLVQVQDSFRQLLVTFHHVIFDGSSISTFHRDLANCYEASLSGKPRNLDHGDQIHYIEYSHLEQESLRSGSFQTQLEYWKKVFQVPVLHLDLPTDFPASSALSNSGDRCRLQLNPSVSAGILEAARAHNCTPFMVVLFAWKLLMHKYTHQEDIVVGTFLANRNSPDIQETIGFFTNTIAVRSEMPHDREISSLLDSLKHTVLDALDNSDLPYDSVVSEINPGENGLFRTAVVFQNLDFGRDISVGPMKMTIRNLDAAYTGSAKFDLLLEMYYPSEGDLCGWIEYRKDLWRRDTIENLSSHFVRLLAQLPSLIEDGSKTISDIDILSPLEKKVILQDWHPVSSGTKDPATMGCVHDRFQNITEIYPHNIAVQFESKKLSYHELNSGANQLARFLQTKGVKPGQFVTVYLPRNQALLVGILAVLKSGAAYVPVDPIYPVSRINYILHDTRSRLILTTKSISEDLRKSQEFPAEILVIDMEDDPTLDEIKLYEDTNLGKTATPEDLVYVIYTSGSTGNPKGVMIRHYNVIRLFDQLQGWFHWNSDDIWTLFHSYAFDFSVNEIWGALFYGGKVIVIPQTLCRNTLEFHKLLEREKVTVLCNTPSAFQVLIEVDEVTAESENRKTLPNLRKVILGGEMLHFQILKPFLRRHGENNPEIVNLYGITETTVHTTYRPVKWQDVEHDSGSNIGIPIPDLDLYLLDPSLQPVPIGVVGELYIGGLGVAKGYLNLEDLTSKKFVKLPKYGGENIFFRSGDLAKYLPSKEMIYIGRRDDQVKIRGFRIDLNDITSSILKTKGVIKAHTNITRGDSESTSNTQIISFLVAPSMTLTASFSIVVIDQRTKPTEPEQSLTPASLKQSLEKMLPSYMIPTVFILVDDFSLNHNGKLDSSVLLKRYRAGHNRPDYSETSETERALIAMWKTVLNLESVSTGDNFFVIGGNSLLATSVILKLKVLLNKNIPVSLIFTWPVLRDLARAIDELIKSGNPTQYPIVDVDKEAEMEYSLEENGKIPGEKIPKDGVLLTGATGFVGCFFLLELLAKTSYDIYCIVQAENEEHAVRRIREVISSYEISLSDFPGFDSRVFGLCGDISKPMFGLSENEYERLSGEISAVYHIAAKVTFVEPYSTLKRINVEGTKNVVRFATHNRNKHLHHFSSVSIFSTLHETKGILVAAEDTDCTSSANNCFMGYTDSKLISEKIVWNAQKRGLKVTVYRLGSVWGHSRTGAAHKTDIFARKLSACLTTGCYPSGPEMEDLITVDDACSTILELSLSPHNDGQAFHISNGQRTPLRNIVLSVARFANRTLKPVSLEDWAHEIEMQGDSNHFYPLLSLVTEKQHTPKGMSVWELYSVPPTFGQDNLLRFLPNRKFSPIDDEIIGKYVAFLRRNISFV